MIDFEKLTKKDLIELLGMVLTKCELLDTFADENENENDDWKRGYGLAFRQSSKFIRGLLESAEDIVHLVDDLEKVYKYR